MDGFRALLMIIVGIVGLAMPPSALLFGTRWQLRDGHRAEPSRAYIIYVKVLGGLLLAGGIAWFVVMSLQES